MLNLATFFALQKPVPIAGSPVKMSGHTIATTISFADADPDTIDDSASGFLKAGFKAGDVITVSGSTSNDNTYTIATVTAGTITLIAADTLTTEVAGDTVTIEEVNNNIVDPASPVNQGTPVPDGVDVIIEAIDSNTGVVYVGNSSANALSTSPSNFPLNAAEYLKLKVQNINVIWVDAATSGDGVKILFEK